MSVGKDWLELDTACAVLQATWKENVGQRLVLQQQLLRAQQEVLDAYSKEEASNEERHVGDGSIGPWQVSMVPLSSIKEGQITWCICIKESGEGDSWLLE
eukprot:793690-Pelagomonas_calceolata.AAC.2